MTDETLINVLTIQLAISQAKILALETILIRNKQCSAEGLAAATEEILTQHLEVIAGKTRSEIAALVAVIEQGGVSFDIILERLHSRREKWTLGPGDAK
jgi:hypothetical protein